MPPPHLRPDFVHLVTSFPEWIFCGVVTLRDLHYKNYWMPPTFFKKIAEMPPLCKKITEMPPTFFAEMLSKKIAEMPPLLLLGELRKKIWVK